MSVVKTFNIGIFIGIALAAVVTYALPVVELHREQSYISVQTNGGNTETFRINIPADRIVLGGTLNDVPEGLLWPDDAVLDGSLTEIFKLRNEKNAVVGVASRIAGTAAANGQIVEWTLHLPARGSIYASMEPGAAKDGFRNGSMRAGTREFLNMGGSVRERFLRAESSSGAMDGRIELVTALIRQGDSQ